MIELSPTDLDAVRAILALHVPECEVLAFGSRVRGGAQRYSDLDLVLIGDGPLDWRRLERVKDAFSESDLPIIVDVLDWHALTGAFRQRVVECRETIQAGCAPG